MANVGTHNFQGEWLQVIGIAGTGDNAVVAEIENAGKFREFTLFSTAGAMDVLISLDGTNFSTAPLSLADLGAVVTDPVIVTVANRIYRFVGTYKSIRVLQNGATAVANAILQAGRVGY